MTLDEKYKLIMAFWVSAIIGAVIMVLFTQASALSRLQSEREYLRARLFAEMNLRAEVQRTVDVQVQTHALYEVEIGSLRQQAEMLRADAYIARVNHKLSTNDRRRIVQAAFACAEAAGLEPSLILAVIKRESHFNPRAVGLKKERGLMQLMPMTAAELGVPWGRAFDIEQNVCAGAEYLAKRRAQHRDPWAGVGGYNGFGEGYADGVRTSYAVIKAKLGERR